MPIMQYFPTKIIFGDGKISELKKEISTYSPNNILIVTGKKSSDTTAAKIIKDLPEYNVIVFKVESGTSDFKTINKCTKIAKKYDLIIGLGGGSPLDTGKCAAILANNDGNVEDYLVTKERKLKNESLPYIAIPTTSGTGSEVTPWATVWDTKNKKKYSLAHLPMMFPKIAIVDSELTETMPPKVTACTGMDALCQGIESYWSKNADEFSEPYALQAIELAYNNLEKAVQGDKAARSNMALAALYGGLAIAHTKTTACHAISYPMTAHYDVPHGLACALTVGEVLKFNEPAMGNKGLEIAKRIGANSVNEAAKNIKQLITNIGLPITLHDAGIKDIEIVVKDGFTPDRVKHNPRELKVDDLREILKNIY
jgi:alcohol dehydrogenase class IV